MIGLLVAICCAMFAQVIARYVFNNSMSWPEEFCRYCYIWTTFLSLGYTIRHDNTLRVGVVMDLFPARVQGIVRISVCTIMITLFSTLLLQSIRTVDNIRNVTQEISSAMQVPMWIMYLSATTGFALAVIRSCQDLYKNIRRFGKRDKTTTEATIQEATAETKSAFRELPHKSSRWKRRHAK